MDPLTRPLRSLSDDPSKPPNLHEDHTVKGGFKGGFKGGVKGGVKGGFTFISGHAPGGPDSTTLAASNHGRNLVQLSPTCTVEVEIVFDKPTEFWKWPEIRQR